MKKNYALGFISDKDIYEHVKNTVLSYRSKINLDEFNKNIIDPIKLTFDAKIYNKSMEDIIESEVIRQIDKSNTNLIGYFHQNIFHFINEKWKVLKNGYDIVNEEENIYVEMKNKHNTMNSSSSQKTFMRMLNTVNQNSKALCLLVEVIAKNSQNIKWKVSLDNSPISDERIRRISIDKFYEMVTGDKNAFKKLCEELPQIIEDVVLDTESRENTNTVVEELKKISPNLLKSIYIFSFKKYEGFNEFNI